MTIKAVLDLGKIRMVETEDGIQFFINTDIPIMFLNKEEKEKLSQYFKQLS